jgi:MFS transporter, DHA1 family, inner membrane transport protein
MIESTDILQVVADLCQLMNRKEKILLIILASINFTHILDFMIMMPLGNYLMPFFKITPQQFTLLVAAYTISAGISGFVAAFFVDKYDRKKILLIGYSGFLLGTIACGFAPSYLLLLFSRIFAGIFGGLIGAQVLSIVADTFTYERRGAAMGAVMSSFSIASTFGVPFSLYLANIISWHLPFLFIGFVGIVLIPLINKYVPSMDAHIIVVDQKRDKLAVLTSVLKNPKQRLALLFSGLIMMGHFLIIPFINPYMEFNNGYSKQQTPLIYLVGGIAAFFASNILGRLSDKYGKLKVFIICIIVSLPLVVIITNMPPIFFPVVLTFFAVWFIVATGRGVTAQAMISNVVETEKRGSFMSFNSSVQQLGTGVASLVAGFVVLEGAGGKIMRYSWLGYLSIAVLLICAWLGYKIFGRQNGLTNTGKISESQASQVLVE